MKKLLSLVLALSMLVCTLTLASCASPDSVLKEADDARRLRLTENVEFYPSFNHGVIHGSTNGFALSDQSKNHSVYW